jgi:hypothetical protein
MENMERYIYFTFLKKEMEELIYRFGTYAHGTKKELGEITLEKIKSEVREYVLRPK